MMDALFSQDEVTEMAKAEARKEGEEKGIFALCKLVISKTISKKKAADLLDMTLAEFEKCYKKFTMAAAAAI